MVAAVLELLEAHFAFYCLNLIFQIDLSVWSFTYVPSVSHPRLNSHKELSPSCREGRNLVWLAYTIFVCVKVYILCFCLRLYEETAGSNPDLKSFFLVMVCLQSLLFLDYGSSTASHENSCQLLSLPTDPQA